MPTGKQRVRNYPKTSILAKSLDAVKSRYEPVNSVGQVKLSQLEEAAARKGPEKYQGRIITKLLISTTSIKRGR